jgi:hypothetical protein
MTDPLRPFAERIRSLRRESTGKAARTTESAGSVGSAQGGARAARPPRTAESLRLRLQARIAGVAPDDPRRMREAFVETVLLWELGEELATDAALGDLVTRVSEQLVADPEVAERMHQMLLGLLQPGGVRPKR